MVAIAKYEREVIRLLVGSQLHPSIVAGLAWGDSALPADIRSQEIRITTAEQAVAADGQAEEGPSDAQ